MDKKKMVQFRVSEEEATLIKEAAWRRKMTLAGWLRRTALATARAQVEEKK